MKFSILGLKKMKKAKKMGVECAMGGESSAEDELDESKDWKTFVFGQHYSV